MNLKIVDTMHHGYGVSEDGKVWSQWSNRHRFISGKWHEVSGSTNSQGYLQIKICGRTKKLMVLAHVLIASVFLPKPDSKLQINHIDGNKKNNSITNLEWVTGSQNMIHAVKTGLLKVRQGEKAPYRKLSEEEVFDIKFNTSCSCKYTASLYGVSKSLVSAIRRNEVWKTVSMFPQEQQ